MYIYGLIEPSGPELFYVGRTAKPSARLRKHKQLNNAHNGRKLRERIRTIKQSGALLGMVILEQTTDKLREFEWIAFFDHLGLVNTVRRPFVPYTKKTSEELSAICRNTWFRRQGHPPAAPYVKKGNYIHESLTLSE